MNKIQLTLKVFALGLATFAVTSCGVPKDVAYFQDANTEAVFETVQKVPIRVKPGDKLAIVVKTKDPQISSLFNLPIYSSRIGVGGSSNGSSAELRVYNGASAETTASYTVTPKGEIDFPLLGMLNVEGMTRSELGAFLKGEIEGRQLAKNVTVVVEFLNSGFNVMGEVNNPGRYDLNRDDLNLLEALSLAGDLSLTGQRKNVRVFRKSGDKLQTYVVDLTNTASLMKSPAFYLQQDDVIYVEPNDVKKRSTTINGNNMMNASFWISVASVMTSIVTTVAVFRR